MTTEQTQSMEALKQHVGCGSLNDYGRCSTCAKIRQMLARVQELEAERAKLTTDLKVEQAVSARLRVSWNEDVAREQTRAKKAEARVQELGVDRAEARQAATELLQAVNVVRIELANRSVLELDASERARKADARVQELERELASLQRTPNR